MIDPNISFSVIPVFLGWVRSLLSWVWSALTGGGSGGLLGWLARHWVPVVIVLCLLGALIDLAVYLLRWRPDVVLRSFARRLKEGPLEAEPPAPIPAEPQDIYEPDGHAESAPVPRRMSRHRHRRTEALTARLLEATRPHDTDEATRLATYRPVMMSVRSQSFREPVYPEAQPEEPSDQQG